MTPIVPVETNPTGTVATATTESAPTPEQAANQAAHIPPTQAPPVLDAIKQARYDAANAQLVAQAKAVADAAAAEALAAKQAEAAKAAEADQVTALTTKLTEAQTQATTLAERAKMAEKLEAASTLAKSGKHYEALQLLKEATGADMDIAVQELINPGSMPKPVSEPAKAEDEPPAVKALREQVEALNKKLADADAAQQAMAKEAGRKSIVAHVNGAKDQYPFLASNESWINQALLDAEQDYGKAVTDNKGQDLSQEQKNLLIDKALKAAEVKHREQATNYAKILGLSVKTPTVVVDKPVSKPTLTYTGTGPGLTPAVPQGKVKSLDELKRARRAN
jgi:hypothetical protein